jgi:hypothetical protein
MSRMRWDPSSEHVWTVCCAMVSSVKVKVSAEGHTQSKSESEQGSPQFSVVLAPVP